MNGGPVAKSSKEGQPIGEGQRRLPGEGELGTGLWGLGGLWMGAGGSSLFTWEEDRLWMLTVCCVISDRRLYLSEPCGFLLCKLWVLLEPTSQDC